MSCRNNLFALRDIVKVKEIVSFVFHKSRCNKIEHVDDRWKVSNCASYLHCVLVIINHWIVMICTGYWPRINHKLKQRSLQCANTLAVSKSSPQYNPQTKKQIINENEHPLLKSLATKSSWNRDVVTVYRTINYHMIYFCSAQYILPGQVCIEFGRSHFSIGSGAILVCTRHSISRFRFSLSLWI